MRAYPTPELPSVRSATRAVWRNLFACLFGLVVLAPVVHAGESDKVVVEQKNGVAVIHNGRIEVRFDLAKGTWGAASVPDGRVLITGASVQVNEFSSATAGAIHTLVSEPLADALGMGRSLLVTSALPAGPKLLLRVSL